MFRILSLCVALFATPAFAQDISTPTIAPRAWLEQIRPAAGFTCANVSCTRLRSCKEACYKLVVCGQAIRDKDRDGIPCENLCSR